ncbi:MAG: M42 family metallopeptidase [Erysipelotrichaceae bacterium]
MIDIKMIEDLSNVSAISGNEKYATRVMKNYLKDVVDEFEYDNLGSLIAKSNSSFNKVDAPKIMISSHIDEIGFVVKEIDESGFIRINPIGGWWAHVLPSSGMILTTRDDKQFYGVIGTKAPHGMSKEEKSKVVELKDLFLDLGLTTAKEALELGIKPGDMITPDTKFKVMANQQCFDGKALDNRIGVAAAIEVMKNISKLKHDATVYAVGSVQEEVGCRGALTATSRIHPDIAFSLDVTIANDTPNMERNDVKLGCGAVLSLMDASHLVHRGLLYKLEEIAKSNNISFVYDSMLGGGTDTGNIHKSYDGVIAMTLSIPARYIHSAHSIISRIDYEATINLLTEFIANFTTKDLEELRKTNQ